MGAVYKARDTVLGRDVAVKVLPDRLRTDSLAKARFTREARLLASLSHPNILAIHDFGEEETIAFAVMELLEGIVLRHRLRDGPLPLDEALALGLSLAQGLAAAHAKGIMHRDLKPENVFLPAQGGLKILDFGLARSAAADAGDDTTLTQPGTILGTFAYMSPEQVRGVEADPRSDVFAFGAVLHEMLTGRPPFSGPSPADVMSAVLTIDAPPLSGTLAFVNALVRRCLEKDPEARFRSAVELVPALQELRPHPSAVADVLAAQRPAVRPMPVPSIAVLPFADMSAGRSLDYLCEGLAEEILLALSRVEGLRVVARTSAFRFKATVQDVRSIGSALGVDTVLEGSVRLAGDRIRVVTELVGTADGYQLWSDRFDRRFDDVFALQDEIAATVAAMLRVRLRGSSGIQTVPPRPGDAEAYRLYLKGRHHWNKRTEADLHQSVAYFKACIARDPAYADAHGGLAEAYATLGIYGATAPEAAMPLAQAAAERALVIFARVPGALAALGCVHALYRWSWTEAECDFRLAIDAMPGASSARSWYALNCLVPLGRFDEADTELRRALEVDPLSGAITTGVGACLYYARRFEKAVDQLRDVLEVDSRFALARYFLALTLAELGRHDAALSEIDQAVEHSGGSPEMIAASGYILARAGRTDAARARHDALQALSTERYVSPVLLAQIDAGLGAVDAAVAWLEKAFDGRASNLAWVGVRPTFDGLRNDARFQQMTARLGVRNS